MTNQELANEYGLDEKIILEITTLLKNNSQVKESDLNNLLELVCFDYMHLDCQENLQYLSDAQIKDMLSDEDIVGDIMADKMNDLNDFTVDLPALVDEVVDLFYDKDKDYQNIYIS